MTEYISINEAIEILDNPDHQEWRLCQVDYPEATNGIYSIQKFAIPKYDYTRLRYIENEGMDRDTGWGDFHRLVERMPEHLTKEQKAESFRHSDGHNYKIWMSDTRAEIMEHSPMLNKLWLCSGFGQAKRVLINGLGLGVIVHAALGYDRVEHVDVVESNARIIELVGQYVTADPRVTIHLADAYAIKWPKGTRWDLAWHDIWPTISDENIPGMKQLHRKYGHRVGWQGSWQRDQCEQLARDIQEAKEAYAARKGNKS